MMMKRGIIVRMRRGSRVTRPTIFFQSRGGRGLPEKGALFVVITTIAHWKNPIFQQLAFRFKGFLSDLF